MEDVRQRQLHQASEPVSNSEPLKTDSILIVGAGIFGLSTALELNKRGYTKSFYPSGFVLMADKNADSTYVMKSKATSEKLGDYRGDITDASNGLAAYFNPLGGWADAQSAVCFLAQECSQRGISFITGPRRRATSLRIRPRDKRVVGVNVAEGEPIFATQIILATGAWSGQLLPISHASSASGQFVGFIQLTPKEAESLRGMPVIMNFSTGVFVFPPYPGSNLLKVAHHRFGVANQVAVDNGSRLGSSPKLAENNAEAGYLPEDADRHLRDSLKQLVPQFGDRPWWRRRMCWYSDTPDGDFIAYFHPDLQGLFIATGGSANAFKFTLVLGRYIADCFENKASDECRNKCRLKAPDGKVGMPKQGDRSRGGQPWRLLLPHEQAKL
ncbi:FAD dependent oxidoreductase-domain-containing protein [Aspergillus sergii]|uniref:FAD dependent oxidoreductase-domain-containing protein n=1 Tax=Aspergillus sergii TaxID=1034303 RepID=A0A5N6WRZ4_9EURO|nr:FAD dependent oxidoreductase-domain-containing protein [Aspergillus sergii]